MGNILRRRSSLDKAQKLAKKNAKLNRESTVKTQTGDLPGARRTSISGRASICRDGDGSIPDGSAAAAAAAAAATAASTRNSGGGVVVMYEGISMTPDTTTAAAAAAGAGATRGATTTFSTNGPPAAVMMSPVVDHDRGRAVTFGGGGGGDGSSTSAIHQHQGPPKRGVSFNTTVHQKVFFIDDGSVSSPCSPEQFVTPIRSDSETHTIHSPPPPITHQSSSSSASPSTTTHPTSTSSATATAVAIAAQQQAALLAASDALAIHNEEHSVPSTQRNSYEPVTVVVAPAAEM